METTVKATPAQVKQAVADYFKEHGLTMAEAGLKMNMSRASVSYALSMQDKYFTRAQAVKYAHYFNMSIDYLTQGEGELLAPNASLSEVMEQVVERDSSGTVVPKYWREKMLQHEESRYNQAQADLVDLETILDVLRRANSSFRFRQHMLEKRPVNPDRLAEQTVLIKRRMNEITRAIDYIMGKIGTTKRIISDIEEERDRRAHPELWEKADGKKPDSSSEVEPQDELSLYFAFDEEDLKELGLDKDR